MHLLWNGLTESIRLLFSGDPEVARIAGVSLQVSGLSTLISVLIGLPLGTVFALGQFRTRRFWVSLVNTGMALPPVVVGLVVSIFLWRSGPLGSLGLMYTRAAMVIAQTIIAAPVITGLTISAMQSLNPRLPLQLYGLGANKLQVVLLLWREARLPLLAALMAGFGSVISEVGASMMVGGNLKGDTRVLTTAIVTENSRGEFAMALALSAILLLLAYAVNLILTLLQQRGEKHG
jgi:tungstate transport system permease protein